MKHASHLSSSGNFLERSADRVCSNPLMRLAFTIQVHMWSQRPQGMHRAEDHKRPGYLTRKLNIKHLPPTGIRSVQEN